MAVSHIIPVHVRKFLRGAERAGKRFVAGSIASVPVLRDYCNQPLKGVHLRVEKAVGSGTVEIFYSETAGERVETSLDRIPNSTLLENAIKREMAFAATRPYLGYVRDARLIGDYGNVVTSDGYLLEDTAPYSHQSGLSPLYELRLPRITRYKGSAAFLSVPFHQNYYHWLIDGIPRFLLLLSVRRDFDWFIVPDGKSFQRETVALLGLNPDQCISPCHDLQLQFDTVAYSSPTSAFQVANAGSCRAVREFVPQAEKQPSRSRRIYITRQDARYRKVKNEAQLIAELRTRGFEVLSLSGLSIVQQRKLFSEAAIVIGVHGAGLTNMVFCKPETVVVEIGNTAYPNPCYMYLATSSRLRYRWCGGHSAEGVKKGPNADIMVNVASLTGLLDSHEVPIFLANEPQFSS